MYLILNPAKRIMDITARAQYVRRQDNGVVINCAEEEADAIYSTNSDRFYPLEPTGYIGDGHTLAEVSEVPAEVEAGYYFFHAGEFYSTEDNLARLAQAKAEADIVPVANIVFVTLAEAGQLDDVTATEHLSQFSEWEYPVAYTVGQIRRYDTKLYRCAQAHTSQESWAPSLTPALWTAIGDPAEEWPDWSQPIGAHDAYATGDKVSYSGKHWVSTCDGNVWSPGTYGWTEA